MMPSLFLAHGSPMIALEESEYGRFLDQMAEGLPKPRAVVIFSAHYESLVQKVSSVERYTTMYDFGGFPEELYRVSYTPPGDKTLALEIVARLKAAGVPAEEETDRGLDHGAWTLLNRVYPSADVPVVEMSVNAKLTPEEQYKIGEALSPLREQGVLIIGSGVTVHNFQVMREARQDGTVVPWVEEFDSWLTAKLEAWDLDALFHYTDKGPHAAQAVPPSGNEHFVPLFYAMGAADHDLTTQVLYRGYLWGIMTNTAYRFGKD